MKISIVIPIYNVGSFLNETLMSVVNQTYNDIEIICVDDGSTDSCSRVMADFASKDKRVVIISQQNSGTYIARQNGVKAATGDYVLFMDGDDWLEITACERLAEFVKENDADIIQLGAYMEASENDSETARVCGEWINVQLDRIIGSDNILNQCMIARTVPGNIITKAVKTSIVKKAMSCQEPLRMTTMEDTIALFYIMLFSESWARLDAKLYHYRIGVGTSTKRNLQLGDVIRSMNSYAGLQALRWYVANHPVSETARKIVNEIFINQMMTDTFYYFSRLKSNVPCAKWLETIDETTDYKELAYAMVGVKAKETFMQQEQERIRRDDVERALQEQLTRTQGELTNLQGDYGKLQCENNELKLENSIQNMNNKRLQTELSRDSIYLNSNPLIKVIYKLHRAYRKHIKKYDLY